MSSEHAPAILLAAFGTLQPSARATYEKIKAFYKHEFPNSEVRIAFTSGFIRRRLKGEGIFIQSPLTALSELHDQDFHDVVVQPLQVVPGKEFHEIASLVQGLRNVRGRFGFRSLVMGLPLLTSLKDCNKVSAAMKPIFEVINGTIDREKIATVLVGHGTGHPADSLYLQMATILERDYGNVFFGTLEGYPGIEETLLLLKGSKVERARLMPFLLVVGGHAMSNIAGEGTHSWRSILEHEGFEIEACLKGIGDEEGILRIFSEHTSKALERLTEAE